MRVYVVTRRDDPFELPCGVFDTLRECAEYIGITLDYLKHCRYHPCSLYVTKYFVVEGVVLENN